MSFLLVWKLKLWCVQRYDGANAKQVATWYLNSWECDRRIGAAIMWRMWWGVIWSRVEFQSQMKMNRLWEIASTCCVIAPSPVCVRRACVCSRASAKVELFWWVTSGDHVWRSKWFQLTEEERDAAACEQKNSQHVSLVPGEQIEQRDGRETARETERQREREFKSNVQNEQIIDLLSCRTARHVISLGRFPLCNIGLQD